MTAPRLSDAAAGAILADPDIDAAVNFAAGAWARGGHLDPPPELGLPYAADRNAWRWWQGAQRQARDLLDPLDDEPPVNSSSLRDIIARALVISADRFGFGAPSSKEAIAAANDIVGEAVRRVERDAIQRVARGNGKGAEEQHDGTPFPDEEPRAHGNSADGDGAPALRLQPRLTRAEMARNSIRFLCPRARFLPRGVATLGTGSGGVGKTRCFLQLADTLATGAAPFGCEYLEPDGAQVVLYIGAEDRAPFFHSMVAPLLAAADATLPFDVMLLPEVRPGFTLSPATARELGRFLTEYRDTHGALDLVILDPMVALIGADYADMMKNPVVSRAFFNECLLPLFAGHDFALLTGNHDSKAGAAVTGSADQQNAARCVLQFTVGEPAADGTLPVTAERVKDNCGFRFRTLVLDRDPTTLRLTWNEAASTYAYGAPEGHGATATPSGDPAALQEYLCRLAAKLLFPSLAPAAQRGKRAMEGRLTQIAARDGHQKAREHVRRCLDAFCDFEPDRTIRKGRRMVLCGVRNPNAAIGDHNDYLAGRAPIEPEADPSPEPKDQSEKPSEESTTCD